MTENIKYKTPRGETANRAKRKYNSANYDRIELVVPKGTKDKLKVYCTDNNTTINGLINDFIKSLDL